MSIVIKVKKLRKFAQMPIRTTAGAAAFDLTVEGEPEMVEDGTGLIIIYGSGLAFEFPEGVYALLMARSSCYKKAHSLANGVGLIDSDYRGEVKGVFYTRNSHFRYRDGERFAQLLVQGKGINASYDIRFQEVAELSDTERGAGGFGSTDKLTGVTK